MTPNRTFSIIISEEMRQYLRRVAFEHEASVSGAIRMIIEKSMKGETAHAVDA